MDKIIKMYGFYDEQGEMIDCIARLNLDDAIAWYKKEYPNTPYMYVDVIY